GFPELGWMGRLPAYAQANFVAWAPGIVSFCFAVVVAVGVAALEDGAFKRRRLLLGMAVLAVVVVVLLLAHRPVPVAPLHHSPWRQYFLYAVALAAAGGVLVACVASAWLPRFRRLAAPFAAGVLLVELTVMFAPGAYLPRRDPFRTPSWMPALQ